MTDTGPCLFLVFVNDLASIPQSNCFLFVDDVKSLKDIMTVGDHTALQSDLDRSYMWSSENRLQFGLTKCKVTSTGHQFTNGYRLGSQQWQRSPKKSNRKVMVQDGNDVQNRPKMHRECSFCTTN
ncbi:unnamed protein product, partial [Dicrocoelium dendriticum]